MLVAAAVVALAIHANFDGGSIGKVERVSDDRYRLGAKGETDQDGRNRQASWYYFRVDGAKVGQTLTLDIVDLAGEYNYQPNRGAITADTPPVISYDRVHWIHVADFEYDRNEPKLTLRIQPRASTFWIAHCPPYVGENLAKLRAEAMRNPAFREEVVGRTVGGRDIPLWTIGRGDPARLPVVWLMFRQHSWESGSSWAGEGAVRELLGDSPRSRSLRERAVWKIFPMCDPDGVARGGVRFNANGFDLNRNWDVVDPARMPEIAAQRAAVRKWVEAGGRVDLLLSLHNTETGEYLEGPPDAGAGKFKALAERLFDTLKQQTSFDPARPLTYAAETTTAGKPGRMTAVQGLYAEFGIPGFLMEQRIAFNPKLGHLPEIGDRVAFGGQLVRAMAATLPER